MEIKDLKEIGFKTGTLKTITKDDLYIKQKIVYQKLPHYNESYVYACLENLNVFYFGDKNDSEFFTLTVKSIQQIKNLLKALDFEKYDAEKWVLDFIEGAEPKTYPSGDVGWWKGGTWLFTQCFKNGYLWVNYYTIWLVLENEFGLKDDEIRALIKSVMYDYTNNGSLTPVKDVMKKINGCMATQIMVN